jgi:hypothetical protein
MIKNIPEDDIVYAIIDYYQDYRFNEIRVLIDDTVSDKADICMLNNINNVHFEDTPRCKFYKEMEQCELNYLSTKGSNDLSVGDIDFLCNREHKKAITEYNTLCAQYNPPVTYLEDLRNKIIVEPITKSKDALNYVKLKKNNAQKNITK